LLHVKAPVQTRVERPVGGPAPGRPFDPSDTMVLPLSNVVGQAGVGAGDGRAGPAAAKPARARTVGWIAVVAALVLGAAGWGAYPLLVAAVPMPLGRFD